MRELSQSEKFKLAKSVLQKGMNITDIFPKTLSSKMKI